MQESLITSFTNLFHQSMLPHLNISVSKSGTYEIKKTKIIKQTSIANPSPHQPVRHCSTCSQTGNINASYNKICVTTTNIRQCQQNAGDTFVPLCKSDSYSICEIISYTTGSVKNLKLENMSSLYDKRYIFST